LHGQAAPEEDEDEIGGVVTVIPVLHEKLIDSLERFSILAVIAAGWRPISQTGLGGYEGE